MVNHVYRFESDGTVNPEDLMDTTRQTLEQYEAAYADDKDKYFHRLAAAGRLQHEGMPYVYTREANDSREEAVVFHSAWATPVTAGKTADDVASFVQDEQAERPKKLDTNRWTRLIQADLTYQILKNAGITDDAGNNLPVIVIPSPSIDRKGISEDWDHTSLPVRRLARMGETVLSFLDHRGFGKLHLGGASQGSAVMGEVVTSNYGYPGDMFDIESSLHCETPNIKKRNLVGFAKAYFTDPSTDWQNGGPAPRREIARGGEYYDWKNVYGNGNALHNLRLAVDMSRGGFETAMAEAKRKGVAMTIEYGTESKVSKGTEDFLKSEEAIELAVAGLLQVIKSTGFAPHSHTEQIVAMSDMQVRSVLHGKRTR